MLYLIPMSKMTRSGTATVLAFSLLTALVASCGESDEPNTNADLPAGWQNAEKIAELTQMQCDGSASLDAEPVVEVALLGGALRIDYEHAYFRCSQDVEGFVRRSGSKVDVLVQPIELDPVTVPKCSCSYHLTIDIEIDPGTYQVSVYHRSDRYGQDTGESEPKRVGKAEVEVLAEGQCIHELDALLDHVGVTAFERKDCGHFNSAEADAISKGLECLLSTEQGKGAQLDVNRCIDCAIPSTYVITPEGKLFDIYRESDVLGDDVREVKVVSCTGLEDVGNGDIECKGAKELYACEDALPTR